MRNTVSATDKARLTRPNENVRGQEASRNRLETLRGDEKNLAPGRRKNFAPNQETAFQPSGNGISGHAVLLSLAAFGS
jgi:hypothetical protein